MLILNNGFICSLVVKTIKCLNYFEAMYVRIHMKAKMFDFICCSDISEDTISHIM